MAFINRKKILSVIQVKEILVDNTIEVSFGNVKVLGTALVTSASPIVNKVIEDTLYSFNSSVSGNTLSNSTATISNNTITF